MTNSNFNRDIKLEIIGTTIEIEDLDIDIEIKASIDQTPNEATVKIWNLSDDTISILKKDATGVRISYKVPNDDNEGYRIVFEGNKRDRIKTTKGTKIKNTRGKKDKIQRQIEPEQDGADEATVINLGENYLKYTNIYYQKTFKNEINSKYIISDIASKMGVAVKYVDNVPFVKYRDGVTFKTSAKNALNTVCDRMGCKWSFQGGAISIAQTLTNDKLRKVVVNQYDSTNASKPNYKDNDEIEISTVLSVEVIPGQWISLDMQQVKDTLRVVKAEHMISNYSSVSESKLTVKEVS